MALHQTAKCGGFEAGRTVEGSSLYPNFPHEQPPFPAEPLFGANVSVSMRYLASVGQVLNLPNTPGTQRTLPVIS